jgi:hypothetical protein
LGLGESFQPVPDRRQQNVDLVFQGAQLIVEGDQYFARVLVGIAFQNLGLSLSTFEDRVRSLISGLDEGVLLKQLGSVFLRELDDTQTLFFCLG